MSMELYHIDTDFHIGRRHYAGQPHYRFVTKRYRIMPAKGGGAGLEKLSGTPRRRRRAKKSNAGVPLHAARYGKQDSNMPLSDYRWQVVQQKPGNGSVGGLPQQFLQACTATLCRFYAVICCYIWDNAVALAYVILPIDKKKPKI